MVPKQKHLRAARDNVYDEAVEKLVERADELLDKIEQSPAVGGGGPPVSAESSVMRIVTGVLLAAMLGSFGFLWNINARLAVIESWQVPPPEVQFRLGEHERRLDNLEMAPNNP